jgi:hypothetical protein
LLKINKLLQKSCQFRHAGQTSLEFSHQLSIFSILHVLYDMMCSHFVQDRTPLRLDQTYAYNVIKCDAFDLIKQTDPYLIADSSGKESKALLRSQVAQ